MPAVQDTSEHADEGANDAGTDDPVIDDGAGDDGDGDGDGDGALAAPAAWRIVTSLLLSLAGLGVSIYLTVDHFAKIAPVCSGNGFVNCQKVTTSAESYFPPFHGWPHVPVAFLGLCFYVVFTAVNLPVAWRALDRRIHIARFALACLGMGFALYLVCAEFVIIGNICLWCTAVHVLTFCLFVLTVSTVPAMLGWGQRPYAGDYEDDGDDGDEEPG
jgi:uncharacterized membrane protein